MLQPVTKVIFIPKSKTSSVRKNHTKEYCSNGKEGFVSGIENDHISVSPSKTQENSQHNHNGIEEEIEEEQQSSVEAKKTNDWRFSPQESRNFMTMLKTSFPKSLWRECQDIKTLSRVNIFPRRTFKNINPRVSCYEPNFVAKQLRNYKEMNLTLQGTEDLKKELHRDLVSQNPKTINLSSKSNLTFFLPKIPSKAPSNRKSSVPKQFQLTNNPSKDFHRNSNQDCTVDCNKPRLPVLPNLPVYANESLLVSKEQNYLTCNSYLPFESQVNQRMWKLFSNTLPLSHRRKNLLLDWYTSSGDQSFPLKDGSLSPTKHAIPSWLTNSVQDNIEIIGTQAFYHKKHKYFQ